MSAPEEVGPSVHRERRDDGVEVLTLVNGKVNPLCVALLDIDHFKSVNDRYGHAFGDEVLSQVAAVAERLAGGHDDVLIARYGGEEFLVCQQLPWTVARARLEVLREGAAMPGTAGAHRRAAPPLPAAPSAAAAVAAPTGTATEIAMQRSPAEPKAAPMSASVTTSRSASGITTI